MKHIKLIITYLLILLSGFIFSQELPTNGDIYNYEIGDIFHFHEYANGAGSVFSATVNIEILDKYYSDNGDTLFYNSMNKRYEIGSEYPNGIYTETIETIYYTNLNEELEADSINSNPDLYNGRITIFNIFSIPPYQVWRNWYTVGCGHVYHKYSDGEIGVIYEINLVYFKKGEEEWGEEHTIVGISDNPDHYDKSSFINVFPNPVVNQLTFSIPELSEESVLYIKDLSGKIIALFQLSKTQSQLIWDCSHLTSGIYIYQTEINGDVYRGKIIIN